MEKDKIDSPHGVCSKYDSILKIQRKKHRRSRSSSGFLEVFARSHNKLSAMTSTVSCRSPKALEASFTVTKFTRNACRYIRNLGQIYWNALELSIGLSKISKCRNLCIYMTTCLLNMHIGKYLHINQYISFMLCSSLVLFEDGTSTQKSRWMTIMIATARLPGIISRDCPHSRHGTSVIFTQASNNSFTMPFNFASFSFSANTSI